jgi:HipA-like protein
MRAAKIKFKQELAGLLCQHGDGSFTFKYDNQWIANKDQPSISVTLPKAIQEHHHNYLFPFFFNMLPEGANKKAVCKMLRIDENDFFGLLLATAQYDTIGAITVIEASAE